MEKASSFKSLLRFELKSAAIYGGIQFLTRFGGLLALPFYWRSLTPADYGVIALSEMFTAVCNACLGLGLDQAITRLYHEWPAEKRKANVGTVWVAHWTLCLVLGTMGALVLSKTSKLIFPSVEFHPYLFLAMINSTLLSMSLMALATLRIRQKPKEFALYNLVRFILQTGLTLTFVLGLNWGLAGYLKGMTLAAAFLVLIAAAVMLRHARPALNREVLFAAGRYALPLVPAQLLGAFTAMLDRLIIQYTGSLEATGLYAIALKFAAIPNSAHEIVKSTAAPFIFKSVSEGTPEAMAAVRRMIIFYIAPIFGAGIAVMLFMDKVILLLGDPRYFSVIDYVPVLTIVSMIPCLNVYCNGGTLLSKRTEWTLPPVIASLLVFAVSCYFLMPRFGIPGLIVSKFLGNGAAFTMNWQISRRLFPAWDFDWLSFGIFCACSVAVLGAQRLTHRFDLSANTGLSLVIFVMVAGIFVKTLSRLSGIDFWDVARRKAWQ